MEIEKNIDTEPQWYVLKTFAGYENVMNAYEVAVKEKYRFYSYGDAMLII